MRSLTKDSPTCKFCKGEGLLVIHKAGSKDTLTGQVRKEDESRTCWACSGTGKKCLKQK